MDNIPKPIKKLAEKTLSNAANKFVDYAVTKFTGTSIKVFEAEGDVEADKVKTRWEIEKPFWIQAEAVKINRQYSNWCNTLLKATPLIISKENKLPHDDDVFWGFLEHSKEISNEEMQELIAKIIAGEYNEPGTYSMGTLQTIKMLGKKELKLFEKIGTLIINEGQIPQELFHLPESAKKFLAQIGIDFGSLQSLQNLGLFLPNEMTNTIPNPENKNYMVPYFEKNILFAPADKNVVDITIPGFYGLSDIGKQIIKHLNTTENIEYFNWLKSNYNIPGYLIKE